MIKTHTISYLHKYSSNKNYQSLISVLRGGGGVIKNINVVIVAAESISHSRTGNKNRAIVTWHPLCPLLRVAAYASNVFLISECEYILM